MVSLRAAPLLIGVGAFIVCTEFSKDTENSRAVVQTLYSLP
jgi:hypothetical protein